MLRRLAPIVGALALALAGSTNASAHRAALDCSGGYYKNVSGHCVHRPASSPVGATARCWDGTYSYSEHASGTCSHHGGVRLWIHHP